MIAYKTKAVLAASAFSLALLAAPAGAQQPVSTGTNGSTPLTGDVSASTCGQGTATSTGAAVNGCADAAARNGGTADTSLQAKANAQMARERAVATATDADERARSRTQTMVRNGQVQSRTQTFYHQRGQKPVITRSTSKTPHR